MRTITNVTGTELSVCEDLAVRQQKGISKYGVTVQENPLTLQQWLQHAYEEHLDAAVYLKRAIQEIEQPGGGAAIVGTQRDDASYVCSQCGADKNGSRVHGLTHHTYPFMDEKEAQSFVQQLDTTRKC